MASIHPFGNGPGALQCTSEYYKGKGKKQNKKQKKQKQHWHNKDKSLARRIVVAMYYRQVFRLMSRVCWSPARSCYWLFDTLFQPGPQYLQLALMPLNCASLLIGIEMNTGEIT